MYHLIPVLIFTFSNSSLLAAPLFGEPALRYLQNTGACTTCDLRGIDLSHLQLPGVNLAAANLSGAQLENTNLRGANLQNAILLGIDLSSTRLAGANLKGADLSDTDIDQAFEHVEIIGTQLEGARFKYGVVCGPPPEAGGWGCAHFN